MQQLLQNILIKRLLSIRHNAPPPQTQLFACFIQSISLLKLFLLSEYLILSSTYWVGFCPTLKDIILFRLCI